MMISFRKNNRALTLIERLLAERADMSATIFARQAIVTTVFSLTISAAFAIVLTIPNATFVTTSLHDNFHFCDAAYRLSIGQMPHRDYLSFMGLLTSVIPYLGFRLSGTYGGALPTAIAIVLIFVTPVMIYVLISRYRYCIAVPVSLYLLLMIASPMNVGDLPRHINMAMWYNRVSWAILTMMFLMFLKPFRSQKKMYVVLDGMVFGLLTVFLFYLKITYALVALGYLLLIFVIRKENRISIVLSAWIFILCLIGVEIIAGFPLHCNYFSDIVFPLKNSGFVRGGSAELIKDGLRNSYEMAVVFGAWLLISINNRVGFSFNVFVLFSVFSSLFIINQNAQNFHFPIFVAVIAVTMEMSWRMDRSGSRCGRVYLRLSLMVLMSALIIQPVVYRLVALSRHFDYSRQIEMRNERPEALQRFVVSDSVVWDARHGAQIEDLARRGEFERLRTLVSPEGNLFQQEYLESVLSGAETLAALNVRTGRIVVFDFVNPFSFVMNTPPPSDGCGWWSSASDEVAVNYLSHQADIVMVPRRAVSEFRKLRLLDILGDELLRDYTIRAETQWWTVWEKATRRAAD